MTEIDMVLDCYNKLKEKENIKHVLTEVPYMSRCIDMIIVDKNDKVVSIEFKLKNWRKAIEQARDHSLGADISYICLPKPKKSISETMIEELKENGIGLYLYDEKSDEPLREIVPPKPRKNKWVPWVTSLRNMINSVSEQRVFDI